MLEFAGLKAVLTFSLARWMRRGNECGCEEENHPNLGAQVENALPSLREECERRIGKDEDGGR